MENKSFNKLNRNLHQDIDNLWDKCFGDLPISKQRLIKAYGTISSKKSYTHRARVPITVANLQKVELHIFEGDNYFEKGTPQQEQAQALIEKIVNKLKNGNNLTSKVLRDFLKDKKITVGVDKTLADDAGFFGYNPLTKEIYIDLCAGVFHYSKKYPKFFTEDSLAYTIGHELGHAVEEANRSSKTHPNSIGYSSNCWEVESFCDAFGTALCIGAGYNLTSKINKLKMFEKEELARHKDEDPHPPLIERRKLLELMVKAYNSETLSNPSTAYSKDIMMMEWKAPKQESTKEKVSNSSNIER